MSAVKQIDAQTLKLWLENDEAILIDVREVDEYNAAHIKGSTLIPLNTCGPDTLPHDPSKKLVFQCKLGKRGNMACEGCAKAMPERTVYNLEGGIEAWISAGFAIESAA